MQSQDLSPYLNPSADTRTAGARVVRDGLLPDDTHAGRMVVDDVAAWTAARSEVGFVRLRSLSGRVHAAALRFDEAGFGELRCLVWDADEPLPRTITELLAGTTRLVLLADGAGSDPGALGLPGVTDRRGFGEVGIHEAGVLGLVREDRSTRPELDEAAAAGDPIAERFLADEARYDLLALVSLCGEHITVH